MAIGTHYNYNPTSPAQQTREFYTNVGSGTNTLGTYPKAFKGSTDFEIYTVAVGGTALIEGTDYDLKYVDNVLTAKSGYTVYAGYQITNVTYQTVDLYFDYKVVRSYDDAEIFNDFGTQITDLQSNPAASRGYLSGLSISNGTDTEHDIDVQEGLARNDANTGDMILSSAITKQIDATWSVGTGAGGLDTGSVAADSFYYIWLIKETSPGTIVDVLFSLSQTSPTMPAGYTEKRRIRGAVLTDGSANILGFRQKDNDFRFSVYMQEVSDTNTPTSRTLVAMSVPPNFIGKFIFSMFYAGTRYNLFQEVADTDAAPSATNYDLWVNASGTTNNIECTRKVDASSQVAYRTDSAGTDTFINTIGFIDNAEIE